MNNKQYRDAIDRTMNPELTERDKIAMLGMGLAGEAGEVVDSLKKVIYHGHELDREDLVKELGDIAWYYNHLAKHYGITEEEIYEKNIAKLNKRYSKGFSEEDSINREL